MEDKTWLALGIGVAVIGTVGVVYYYKTRPAQLPPGTPLPAVLTSRNVRLSPAFLTTPPVIPPEFANAPGIPRADDNEAQAATRRQIMLGTLGFYAGPVDGSGYTPTYAAAEEAWWHVPRTNVIRGGPAIQYTMVADYVAALQAGIPSRTA